MQYKKLEKNDSPEMPEQVVSDFLVGKRALEQKLN